MHPKHKPSEISNFSSIAIHILDLIVLKLEVRSNQTLKAVSADEKNFLPYFVGSNFHFFWTLPHLFSYSISFGTYFEFFLWRHNLVSCKIYVFVAGVKTLEVCGEQEKAEGQVRLQSHQVSEQRGLILVLVGKKRLLFIGAIYGHQSTLSKLLCLLWASLIGSNFETTIWEVYMSLAHFMNWLWFVLEHSLLDANLICVLGSTTNLTIVFHYSHQQQSLLVIYNGNLTFKMNIWHVLHELVFIVWHSSSFSPLTPASYSWSKCLSSHNPCPLFPHLFGVFILPLYMFPWLASFLFF